MPSERLAGSWSPHQGLNPATTVKVWSPNYWTAREFPPCCFCLPSFPSCTRALSMITESHESLFNLHSLPWNPVCSFCATHSLVRGMPNGAPAGGKGFWAPLHGGRGNRFLLRAHQWLHSLFVKSTTSPDHQHWTCFGREPPDITISGLRAQNPCWHFHILLL